jgi:hypothetical protein
LFVMVFSITCILYLPNYATLVIFPVIPIVISLTLLWRRLTGDYQRDFIIDEGARAHVFRPISFVKVAVKEARGLLNADAGGKSDPFAVVYHDPSYNFFDPAEIGRTITIDDTLDPDWNTGTDASASTSVWDSFSSSIYSVSPSNARGATDDDEVESSASTKRKGESPFQFLWQTSEMTYQPRACWRYPILQPFTKIAGMCQLTPWPQISNKIVIEVYDHDFDLRQLYSDTHDPVKEGDDFLGQVSE